MSSTPRKYIFVLIPKCQITDKEDPGKDEETEIINILDKELGTLMRDDLDAEEERNPALKPKDRFRRRWRRRWRRFSRRVRRSVRRVHRRVRKSVRRARRSVSRRYKRLRNSIRKRLRRIRGFFGGIQNAIRRVRSGMRRVNYTWKMIKSIRTFIRNYPGAPNRR